MDIKEDDRFSIECEIVIEQVDKEYGELGFSVYSKYGELISDDQ